MKKQLRFTQWDMPGTKFDSQYGVVTYLVWCQHEIDRLKAHGHVAEIIRNEQGQIALAR